QLQVGLALAVDRARGAAIPRRDDRGNLHDPCGSSRMKITCIVTRYSAMRPSSTRAFSSSTCRPVMWRSVFRARSRPRSTASCQPTGEADVMVDTDATATASLLLPVLHGLRRHVEHQPQADPVLGDAPVLDL